MNKTTKQVLGFSGLALVAAITAVAYTLPAPAAGAVSSSQDVRVNVNVINKNTEVIITSPEDGTVFTDHLVGVDVNFSHTDVIDYKLTITNRDGTEETIDLPSYISESGNEAGDRSIELDLSKYPTANEFVIWAGAKGPGDNENEDSVSFKYHPLSVEQNGTDDNANPIVDFNYGTGVEKVKFKVYPADSEGNPVTTAEPIYEGEFEPEAAGEAGTKQITIPMTEQNRDAGQYAIVATPYIIQESEEEGVEPVLIAIDDESIAPVEYTGRIIVPDTGGDEEHGNTPSAPDTGVMLFGAIGMSRADYIITGLLIFGLSAAAALVYMRKNAKLEKANRGIRIVENKRSRK